MSIFKRLRKNKVVDRGENRALLAEMVINSITDGVMIVDQMNLVRMINPAAVMMLGCGTVDQAMNTDFAAVLRLENGEGLQIANENNKVIEAIKESESFSTREYVLVTAQNQKRPIAITVTPSNNAHNEKIITFRDISKELEEEGAQAEFISTASHEMRTPVASIEGYLGLALNPQTATIDERARKYLEQAHESSKHLGRLFQDLLDVTKLDDKKIKVRLAPVEVVGLIKSIADGHSQAIREKKLQFSFGAKDTDTSERHVEQNVYALIDIDFLREIINNLLENAIKYTESGGAIWVNVRGEDDQVLVNVTDTGMGISPDDLTHIFQKFYRVDNSQTRTIGGTGLGLYLDKQRAEAMGGKVWAESSFGEGSTFYLTVPRLTQEEYERRKQIIANQNAMNPMMQRPNVTSTTTPTPMPVASMATPVVAPEPVMTPTPVPEPISTPEPTLTPTPAPVAPSQTAASVAPPVTPMQPPIQTKT